MRKISNIILAIALLVPVTIDPAYAHGGGCRKSSPPGQCCHMNNSKGYVILPGEIEDEHFAIRIRDGIPLHELVVADLMKLSDELSIPFQ